MRDDEDTPTMSRGLLRVGTLCLVVVLIAILFWDMFSESAAFGGWRRRQKTIVMLRDAMPTAT
ncbi:hypothetical protein ACCT07_34515 [Rhizobium johnstonii]|uniref:hypothetical protein n=1 Tax=Rhizobium johnstonii TaxID=3019933 RepID=UPI003F9B7F8F